MKKLKNNKIIKFNVLKLLNNISFKIKIKTNKKNKGRLRLWVAMTQNHIIERIADHKNPPYPCMSGEIKYWDGTNNCRDKKNDSTIRIESDWVD